MRIKLGAKKQINEFFGLAEFAFAAVLVGALAQLFEPLLKPFIEKIGVKLDSGSRKTEIAIGKLRLPSVQKKEILDKFKIALSDLRNTLAEIQKNPKDISRKQRPSVILAEKIAALSQVIDETKKTNAEQLKNQPDVLNELNGAMNEINGAWISVNNLDLMSALVSKKDKNGLWYLTPELQQVKALKNDKNWLAFAEAVLMSIPNKNTFKVKAALPTG